MKQKPTTKNKHDSWIHRFIRKIRCYCGFHKYIIAQNLTNHSRRIGCKWCGQTWGMNDDERCLLPWDSELHNLYETINVPLVYHSWEKIQYPTHKFIIDLH